MAYQDHLGDVETLLQKLTEQVVPACINIVLAFEKLNLE